MKSTLIILSILAAVFSAQAKEIPSDSIVEYFETAKMENLARMGRVLQLLDFATESENDDFMSAFNTLELVGTLVINLTWHYVRLYDGRLDSWDDSCDLIVHNLYKLKSAELTLGLNFALTRNQEARTTGRNAVAAIKLLLEDCIESIKNEPCQMEIRKSIASLEQALAR